MFHAEVTLSGRTRRLQPLKSAAVVDVRILIADLQMANTFPK